MKILFSKIISAILWGWFLISSILFTPVILTLWITTVWFDKRRRILHLFSCFWGAQYIWVNPFWKIRINGNDQTKFREPAVIISNHQSLVDILIIYSLFRHFRWTSKSENFRLPFVGWVLALNRSVRINRGKVTAFSPFRKSAIRELKNGNSIMIFPEGTRSGSGKPGPFREGAFLIAIEAGMDILPMVLDGSASAIPKHSWYIRGKSRLRLRVLDRIPAAEIAGMGAGRAREFCQERINTELEKMRNERY